MTVPPIRVDIVAGQNTAIPEIKRTGDALHALAVGAGSGLTPIQKFSRALVMAEGREGTLALRAVRSEVASLAESALGAQNPLARLGITMLEFGIGGATGLAAVAGVAALGKEFSDLIGYSDALEKSLVKVNTEFAQLGGPVAAGRMREQVLGQREPEQPGLFMRLWARLGDPLPFGLAEGDQTQAIEEGFAGQQATFANERALEQRRTQEAHTHVIEQAAEKERGFQRTLTESALAIDKLQLGLHPTNVALADLDHESRSIAIALSNLKPPEKERQQLLENERAAVEHANAVMRDIEEHGGLLADPRRLLGIPTSADLKGGVVPGDKDGFFGKTFGIPKFAPREEFLQEIDKLSPKRVEKLDVAAMSASAVAVLGALNQGGAGGILTSGGGLLEQISKGKGALGTAGLVTTALGGVFNVFNNSEERRHKELLREVKRLQEIAAAGPQRVTPILVGASRMNAAEVAYEVGRYQDRDGVARGVGGMGS